MAKIDLKFLDCKTPNDYIKVEVYEFPDDGGKIISIDGFDSTYDSEFTILLDKSTAIKFAKTLRTEINKIED